MQGVVLQEKSALLWPKDEKYEPVLDGQKVHQKGRCVGPNSLNHVLPRPNVVLTVLEK